MDNALAKNQKRTIYILNENNFVTEDTILILRTFINKLKRLLKIQLEIEKNNKRIDEVISNFRPVIFWKDKDLVKKQIKILPLKKLETLLVKSNDVELSIKKNPSLSINILTNFILDQVA